MFLKTHFHKLCIVLITLILIVSFILKDEILIQISIPMSIVYVFYTHYKAIVSFKKDYKLTPSPNGEKCIGNGQNKDVECMCDECDHFLECYPEWNSENKD